VTGQVTQQDFTMILLGQDPPATLKKYDETRTLYNTSITGVTSIATAMRYTAEELEDMGAVGATIENVSFLLGANNGESVYVIIDIGGEKSLWNITSGYIANRYITVDISDAHLVIPAGEDVYIGVGLTNLVSNTSPFRMYDMPSDNGGCFMMVDFLNDYATWQSGQIFGSPCSVAVSASLSRSAAIDFAALDISYVKLVDGLPQVVPAAGKTVYSVIWYVDGTAVGSNPPAVSELPAGAHTYMARLEYYDGTAERVYYDVTKE
jgi:hypothetical protein